MDSAKIFALGLAAGLAIHVFVRNSNGANAHKQGVQDSNAQAASIASKSAKKNKNKKKNKDAAPAASAPAPVAEPVQQVVKEQLAPLEAKEQASASKKKNKKQKQQQQQQQQTSVAAAGDNTYAAVAEATPAINNDTIRARADAAQTAFTTSLGDMRDAEVDPLPAAYSPVARIPAPELDAPKPKLSKKEIDDGWSSVGGTFSSSSSSAAKINGTSSASKGAVGGNGVQSSIASNNPFAALPNDATTSSVRRIPAKPASKPNGTTAGGSTAASSTGKLRAGAISNGVAAETKKQRSNANKAQAKKAAKEEADRLQAERLANHRRQQAQDAAKQRDAAKRPSPHSVNASSKVPTAKASVDLNGRLVWD